MYVSNLTLFRLSLLVSYFFERKKLGDSHKEGKKANEPLSYGNGTTSLPSRHPEHFTPLTPSHPTLLPVTISKTQPDLKTEFAKRILKLFIAHFPQLKKGIYMHTHTHRHTHTLSPSLSLSSLLSCLFRFLTLSCSCRFKW
jgi:hypothetical protein